MDEEKRNLVYRVVRIAIILWVGLMLLLCGGCGEEPDAVSVAHDYQVSRERAQVKAHVESESADTTEAELYTLPDSVWRDMLDHGRVWTNDVGRAELRADCTQPAGGAPVCNCEAVILYQGSSLVSRPCHPEESAGTCATGQALLVNCDICFETLSSRTCPVGTWVSITYLGQSEITIVTVGEGAATVTPVTVLDYEEIGPFEFEFKAREWSDEPIALEAESIATESGEANLPFFLYTAPEASLKRLMTQAEELGIELPPPGEPLPAEQLPILINPEFGLPPVLDALGWEQPNLQLWIFELSISASEHGDILFPPIPLPDEEPGFTLDFDGEPLGDWRVQEAFVLAIDKEAVTTQAFSAEGVGFTAIIGGEAVDAYTYPYDPERALVMLEEAAYDRDQAVIILFPEEDAQVGDAAKLIAGALSEIDVNVELTPVPGMDLTYAREEFVSGGLPVLIVYR